MMLALLLRFVGLGSNPPALNADEAAIAYNAYSILKTGKDEFSVAYPLVFRSFDDYKMPVYVYMSVPAVALLGLTDVAVRLPSAVLGTLTVFLVFVLVRELMKSGGEQEAGLSGSQRMLPYLAALLLAVSPWHIHFSRSAYEANVAVFFIVSGLIFFLKALQKPVWMIPSAVLFALSVWTYHSSRIFVPLLVIGAAVLFRKRLIPSWRYVGLAGGIGFLVLLPLVSLSLSKEGQMRAFGVSIFSNAAMPDRMVRWLAEDIGNRSLPGALAVIVHNRRFAYIPTIIKGYLDHLSPNFFVSESVLEKYHTPGMGLMYLWELPFLAIGFVRMLREKSVRQSGKLLLWWFLIAPAAASLTEQLPHPVRTLVFLPVVQIITAYGILAAIEELERSSRTMRTVGYWAMSGVFLVSLFYYIHQYFVHLPTDYSAFWQYGRKEAVAAVKDRYNEFDRVVVSTSLDVPHIFFLYYLAYDPARYQKEGGTVSGGFAEERNAFDKFRFKRISDTVIREEQKSGGRVLYVGMPFEMPKWATPVKTIPYLNGSEAFRIFTAPSVASDAAVPIGGGL